MSRLYDCLYAIKSILLRFIHAIKWLHINILVCAMASYIAYTTSISYMGYRATLIEITPPAFDANQYRTSLSFLQQAIHTVFDRAHIYIDGHDLKITTQYNQSSVIAENLLEFSATYRDIMMLLSDLEKKNVIGRIGYIKIEKPKNINDNKLHVQMKTYHLLMIK